jgi:hypothetical protein
LNNQNISKMKEHGGKREGAGRKPKAEEQRLIEKLSPLEDKAFKALENAIDEEHSWAIKLYFEYTYGKPKEKVEITKIKEQPLFGED